MGIDALDLSFRLEKKFGIKVPNREGFAAFLGTAETLHRYLMTKLRGEYREVPAVEPLGIEVSKAVSRVAGRWRWTSSNDLNKRFSPANRERCWEALEKELRVSLPPLEYSPDETFPTIPRQCDSSLSLIYWIIEHHPERVKWFPLSCQRGGPMAERAWTEEEVWEAMCDSLVDVLGVKREEITPDARLVEDLGMA